MLRMMLAVCTALLVLGVAKVGAQEIVTDGPRAVLNLNGEWQSRPHAGVQFAYPPPADSWATEMVPHAKATHIDTIGGPYMMPVSQYLNAAGTGYKSEKIASWFRREFTLPAAALQGRRAVLHLHGVAFKSDVWVNGTRVGGSLLGQVPNDYDVTGALKPGATNLLVIGVAGREGVIDIANKTYIAPASGVQSGIWGDVELRLLPEVRIDDVFVKTSVNEKTIALETTVVNAGKAAAQVRPDALIVDAAGAPQTNIAGETITIPAGEKRTITLKRQWMPARLWTPEAPTLYQAQVSLRRGDALVDRRTDRFGFREFEIRGTDFYLNGVRTTLLRNSFLSSLDAPRSRATRLVREQIANNVNSARLHLGFNAENILDAADELGLMMVPESAWHNMGSKFDLGKSPLWLPQVADYTRRVVLQHRNRPSVIIWSLANENLWGDTDDTRMGIADAVVKAARDADPTRPQQGDGETYWGKRLPIINIHYPESVVGVLRKDYPNASIVEPNDLYWLQKGKQNNAWRAVFDWDRPLVIGEYWWVTGGIDERSSFMGESAYDWEKWRWQSFADGEGRNDNEYSSLLNKITDVYRIQGVAGVNPWSGNRGKTMPEVAVRPLDFHRNFFGGRKTSRRVVVFNDTELTYDDLHLQCRLTVDGKTAWQTVIKQPVPPSEHRIVEIPIEVPVVQRQSEGVLTVRLRTWRGGGHHEIARHEESVFVMPPAAWGTRDGAGIVLLDTRGETATALKALGIDTAPRQMLARQDLAGARTLIVGTGTDAGAYRDVIESFARGGGRVLVLQQDGGTPIVPELADTDDKHVTTRSWLRAYSHPVTSSFDERQFSYWQPDNLVAVRTLNKPSTGDYRILLDAGGLYGMRWAPLVETRLGAGLVVQSQLNLTDRVDREPMAGHLLVSLIDYCQKAGPAPQAPLRLLAEGNEPLRQVLAACSVVTRDGLEGDGPVLLDATYKPSAAEKQRLLAHLAAGGSLWLHGYTPETVGRVADLLPFKPELVEFDKTVHAAARRSTDPWMDNLSSYDFFWTRIDIGARADYFGDSQPTAKLGQYALNLPSVQAGERLVEPGLLTKVPVGRGNVLFDTLAWEGALGGETDKVVRIVSSLASHLGASIQVAPEQSYAYFQVDLKKQANRHYMDDVAGDGKGGWTDQGGNDMRFFLVNHTGLGQGAEVGVGEFPALVNLAGRPFAAIDPKKNDGRAAVIFRGQDHDTGAPAEARGIAVGKRAHKLWFLQTAGWISNKVGEEIARYVIHYDDGTQSVFPIRNKIEISDWWNPGPLSGAKVGWTGKNAEHSPVGLYVTEWTNPHPEKTIASLDAIGSLTPAQLMLVAITGGVEADGKTAQRTVAHWRLGDVKESSVPNRVSGGGALRLGTNAPAVAQAGDRTALRFRGGQTVVGEVKQTLGLTLAKPWVLEATVAPEAKPDGYIGGIYQAMEYGKRGMRLAVSGDLRPVVEIYPGDGKARNIRGNTEMTPGRFYKLEVRFDGTRANLYVNGKLDGSVESPLPAAYDGPIQIGQASGKDYNFNGMISEIKISAVEN